MANKTQEESEASAKVWQVDAITKQLSNIEQLLKDQSAAYISKDAFALAIEKRDNRIKNLESKDRTRSKFIWVLIPIVAALAINTAWTFVINTGRLQ